ncbi:hypothetical protein [Rahnella bonaserana]|jgi:hypothetical protein|uniref:hypothetical protein n=1 Tax=Rahnella bonaserana TaxID=2816248 RepID=UPI00320A3C4F
MDIIKIYRGINYKLDDLTNSVINHYRQVPRLPSNTDEELHKILDNWFQGNFQINARSECIFCTPDKGLASQFKLLDGEVYELVIPEGEPYDIIYSNLVIDLFKDTTQFLKPFNENEVHNFLNSKNYIITNDVNTIPKEFKGELMLNIENYILRRI